MDTGKLIINIIDQIKEAQIKLGFAKETIRLYFPLESLNAILGTDFLRAEDLVNNLEMDPGFLQTPLGELAVGNRKKRIEICVPASGVEYVHKNIEDPQFLKALIRLFETNHHLTIEEICDCFEEYNPAYLCEKMEPETDFDYAVYFPDKQPDAYYYCIKMEMGHTIYHRFAREDYLMLLK